MWEVCPICQTKYSSSHIVRINLYLVGWSISGPAKSTPHTGEVWRGRLCLRAESTVVNLARRVNTALMAWPFSVLTLHIDVHCSPTCANWTLLYLLGHWVVVSLWGAKASLAHLCPYSPTVFFEHNLACFCPLAPELFQALSHPWSIHLQPAGYLDSGKGKVLALAEARFPWR